MLQFATTSRLRAAAWSAATCGVLCSLLFHAFGPYRHFNLDFFGWDILPYVVVAAAVCLGGKRLLASFCLAASVAVLAVGAYAYIDLLRVHEINDIQLLTDPLRWLFAVLAVLVAAMAALVRRFCHVPNNL